MSTRITFSAICLVCFIQSKVNMALNVFCFSILGSQELSVTPVPSSVFSLEVKLDYTFNRSSLHPFM